MWWSSPFGRRVGTLVAVALLGAGTGGCGFHPLYARGPAEQATEASRELAAIRVPPIGDRIGQQLRNYLSDRMTPQGRARQARYILEITLDKSVQDLGIRKDATATRANMVVTANFKLSVIGDEERPSLVNGVARSVASYNILDAQYATIVAEKDAEVRAVHQLADEMINRLALYFRTAGPPPVVPPTGPDAGRPGDGSLEFGTR